VASVSLRRATGARRMAQKTRFADLRHHPSKTSPVEGTVQRKVTGSPSSRSRGH
jgi:hypothetical protein